MADKPFTDAEAISMMSRCREEILDLRRQLAITQPKADAYDNICTILRLLPQRSMGAKEDLVWVLDKRLRELSDTPKREAQ